MEPTFTTLGALLGLVLAIVLIVRKVTPVYALILGGLAGGLLGGGGLVATVSAMISGTQAMMPSVLRILASGVLVGALVKTGSAAKIADAIVTALGSRFALAAVALAAMIVTAVGVFVDIAVITVAPVALAIGRRANISIPALLLAMVGGGKAGNVLSPNPNTIAVAEAFELDLTSVMAANLIPAACAFVMTVFLSSWLAKRWRGDTCDEVKKLGEGEQRNCSTPSVGRHVKDVNHHCSPSPLTFTSLSRSLLGPLTVIILLVLRPTCGIVIDPLVALPAGGLVSTIVCGQWRETVAYSEFGLSKVVKVAILLVGTGTIAGIVKGSGLNADMIRILNACHLPVFALAPLSSVFLSGATASTTAGVTIAAQTFADTLIAAGIPPVSAAAMLHAGGTIFDALPHGSFFHATAGAVGMSVKDRLKLFPFGTLVGMTTTIVSVAVYLLFQWVI